MSVYVDQIRTYEGLKGQVARAGKQWCHLTADSLDELHAMADKIGMRRSWFQAKPLMHMCHYDLVPSRRAAAVRLGAIEVNSMEHMRQLVRDGRADLPAEASR